MNGSREWKKKIDIIDDDERDTMEYDYVNTLKYKPEMNGDGLTGDEHVVIAHPLLLSMILGINVDREELLPMIQIAADYMLDKPSNIYYSGKAIDILFNGITLDCSSEEYEVGAICSEFSGDGYKQIKPINDTAYSFSLFGNVR